MTPKVSVLIHNRNRASILASCLASVAALKHRPLEVIVLDAQSTDESPQVISRAIEAMRRRKIEARQLRCPVMGCPASRNLAAKNATGDFLVFIDNDATFEKDTDITPVLDWFRSDSGLAIVSFRTLLGNSDRLDPFSWVYRRSLPEWCHRQFYTFTFAGTGFCARADAYREVGGFWERLTYSREEEEMSYTLLAAHWNLGYTPAVTIRHYPSARSRTDIVKRRSLELVNGALVMWRRLPLPLAVIAILGRVATMSVRALLQEPKSLPALWRAVGSAAYQLATFGEARRPISFAAAWICIRSHFRDKTPVKS